MLYARTSSWIFQRSFDHLIKWEKNDVEAPQKVHIFFVGFNQQRTHSYKVLRKQFYWCVTHFSYPPSLALSLESDVIHHCEEVFKIDWINTFFYSFLHSLNWTWEALEQKSNEQRSILLNLKYTRVEEAFILITESNFKRVSRCGNHLIKFRVWMIFSVVTVISTSSETSFLRLILRGNY